MCFNEYEMDVPSAEPDSLCVRIGLLYQKNKVLTILVISLIVILILAILFVIIWFAILGKGKSQSTANASPMVAGPGATTTTTTPAGSTTATGSTTPKTTVLLELPPSSLHLRTFQHT